MFGFLLKRHCAQLAVTEPYVIITAKLAAFVKDRENIPYPMYHDKMNALHVRKQVRQFGILSCSAEILNEMKPSIENFPLYILICDG